MQAVTSEFAHVLTVDLEPWFTRGSALFGDTEGLDDNHCPMDGLPANLERLLALLEGYNTRATFFVLGPVAKLRPDLVRMVADAGHEIAVHGYSHKLVYKSTAEEFREDAVRSLEVVGEAAGGGRPLGYRAPYFSVTRASTWALDELAELGFRYDSSIFPVWRRLYGIRDFCTQATWVTTPRGRALFEVPPVAMNYWRWRVPVAGGGYWRVLPTRVITGALSKLEAQGQPAVLYLHPYELNPDDACLDDCVGGMRNRCMLAWQRMGRRGFAGKLEAVLRRFRLGPVRDVFADALSAPEAAREAVRL